METPKRINKTIDDISDAEKELQKVFFSNETPTSQNIVKKVKKINRKVPDPNSALEVPDLKHLIKKDLQPQTSNPDAIQKIVEKLDEKTINEIIEDKGKIEEEDVVKKRGRKLYWTKEKIEELKKQKKLEVTSLRKQRVEKTKLSKLAVDEPLSYYDRRKISHTALQRKQEVENEITKKRTLLKEIEVINLRSNICNHLYSFQFFKDGGVVSSCKKCSAIKLWEMSEWNRYLSQKRKEL